METTFVMVKPDGVQRGLVGEIISRLEARGLQLVGCRFLLVSTELREKHYAVHKDRPFFAALMEYISSGPVCAMAWRGAGAIGVVRSMVGATDPKEAAPGTIRGDYALDIGRNLVHASDGAETAEFETGLWFPDGLVDWSPVNAGQLYE